LKSVHQAQRLIRRSFGKGFKQKRRLHFLRERLWQFRRDHDLRSLLNLAKGIARLFIPTPAERSFARERNYVYFQKFIPNASYDIRVVVIGDRAFGLRREVREGDFRASGSGRIVFDREHIPLACVRIAYQTIDRSGLQSAAFDFVMDNHKPKIVEVSYAFTAHVYESCPGFWNRELVWYPEPVSPEAFMIEDFISAITVSK
jgi:hypothetical protein